MTGRKEQECAEVIHAHGSPLSTPKSRLRRDFSQQKDEAMRMDFNPCPHPPPPSYRSLLSPQGIMARRIAATRAR